MLQPLQIVSIRKSDPDKFADYWLIYGVDFIASASDNPSHPQGVWGFNEVEDWSKWNRGLGLRAEWNDLPVTLQRFLVECFSDEGVEG